MKIWYIDEKAMDVAQHTWLSGCPEKGQFSGKNTKIAILWLP